MKNFTSFFLILWFFPCFAFTQTLIQGRVQQTNGEALPGTVIRVSGKTLESDAAGNFQIELPAGRHTFRASHIGFQTFRQLITVQKSPSQKLIITLNEFIENLQEVSVREGADRSVKPMADVQGTYLLSGKRSEVISLNQVDANIPEKNIRQVFAKIPGAFAYDMDGSGNQINLATRGLDPHRGWEYNIRTNGVLTNSDLYGYPASHFSLPLEAVERIELVRGNASLQYGAQFGGMLNYVLKGPDSSRAVAYETINSIGSFGLQSTFHRLSGTVGKLSYNAYYHRRTSDGYRKNGNSIAEGQFVSLNYAFRSNLVLRAELGRSYYQYHIPGPLTDAQFAQDPRQSTRSRNYFSPDIYLPSLRLDWTISPRTTLQATASAVLGQRNSVTFEGFATRLDTISRVTGQYANRQVDRDQFHSYTFETRMLHRYQIKRVSATFIGGVQLINNDLHRRQLGRGTTGTDYDLSITGDYGRDMHYKTQNIAFFAENLFQITPQFSLTPGIRVETGVTNLSGRLAYTDASAIPPKLIHRFPLLSINGQYRLSKSVNLYGGWAQAYRPAVFKDIIPGSILERANPNTSDARGSNAEMGIRGKEFDDRLTFDITAFDLLYRNRLGSQIITEGTKSFIYKTNIGDSRTRGIEAYAEYAFIQRPRTRVSVFTSTSYMDGRYSKGFVSNGAENINISGNRIESVPRWISRNGLQVSHQGFSTTLQYSYVSKTYADPLNTVKPSATGGVGLVPAYGLIDWYATYRLNRSLTIRGGISNLTNKSYFTKRPTMYPGPGIWSSDGRSVQLTVGLKI
ncbi:TonB-dependent receptor [Siphonobacter sp. SORGH_AS_1065]|uniref:TonB-dependent receptor n=1 Tax=Siphonobacter sp. SORGH_AS_1065 TaxID=3041795 RepID=UPI0027882D58|nr:TonB-dependent receptor [Siphonobacter sp. SORGH_AS_1065]MDQ1086265.1 Fe(3+) dicitrate transport protein [Siphonobacter sp. SORGH_AS_1065]